MQIKRFFLFIVLAAVAAGSMVAQMRFAPTAALTVNNMKFKQDLVDIHQKVGFQAGVLAEMIFPGLGFGFDTGLLYNQQGAGVDFSQKPIWSTQGIGDQHVYIHNIQIPLHLRFKWTRMEGLEEIVAPFVFGGPDFDIQVGHSDTHGAVKFSGGDVGLTAGIGGEFFRRWQLSASYTWGMTYAMKTVLLDDFSAQSRQWTVRVAYFF